MATDHGSGRPRRSTTWLLGGCRARRTTTDEARSLPGAPDRERASGLGRRSSRSARATLPRGRQHPQLRRQGLRGAGRHRERCLGASIGAGDFNGDGRGDVLIGAPREWRNQGGIPRLRQSGTAMVDLAAAATNFVSINGAAAAMRPGTQLPWSGHERRRSLEASSAPRSRRPTGCQGGACSSCSDESPRARSASRRSAPAASRSPVPWAAASSDERSQAQAT